MLLLLTIILTNGLFAQSLADPQDEVEKIDQLIEASNDHIARLKKVRALLIEYKKAEATALKDPNDTDNLLKLVNLAKEILDIINDSSMHDMFSAQFLEELQKFSQISAKKNIPQAK